jgi:hypothetical protein
MNPFRRRLLFAGLSAAVLPTAARGGSAAPRVTVYKSPTCGCCGKWVDHLRAHGFEVTVRDVADVDAYKHKYGVPRHLASCHTALVEGYVIEGHVPADLVHRLLAERPEVIGLAVPGMPIGSPGMEQGNREDPYEVVAFDRTGRVTVYARR